MGCAFLAAWRSAAVHEAGQFALYAPAGERRTERCCLRPPLQRQSAPCSSCWAPQPKASSSESPGSILHCKSKVEKSSDFTFMCALSTRGHGQRGLGNIHGVREIHGVSRVRARHQWHCDRSKLPLRQPWRVLAMATTVHINFRL